MEYHFAGRGSQYIPNINAESFDDIALELFRHQYGQNDLYRRFTEGIGIDPASVTSVARIPFLPISFFKTHKILTGIERNCPLCFESSGTTGETPSRHYVADESLYRESLLAGFRRFYGEPSRYAFLALLPSYLERRNASLVHMAEQLMQESGHSSNGFYLDEWEQLAAVLKSLEAAGQPAILLGVTFALLDFAEAHPVDLRQTIIMETGGMKGRKEEWTRTQVHEYLKARFGLPAIHSEYGMTELLSQAYSKENGIFHCSPSMKVLVRDVNDPLETAAYGTGCLNIIDLSNVDSCAFIATEDIGRVYKDGSFEVLGRMDHAALRGCSLMAV